MSFLDLPTHRLHYRVDGTTSETSDKAWLIFCNSLGTDLRMWDRQIRELADSFRILRYDRRGHGLSSAPPRSYTLADLGGDVISLMDALGIPRAHFCGLSIGGLTGQWLGIHHRARFEKIILCATAAKIGSAEGWTARIDDVRASGLEALVPATAERWFTPEFRASHPDATARVLDSFSRTSKEGYLGCCEALRDADLREDIGSISNPILALSGADDSVCPPNDLEAIAKGVCDGRHLCLPGRHILNVESPDAFNAAVCDFLCR
ncbi:3-oxoadipate enol-lactonase [Rhizobium sp.]|uniref:3-oxoadipate enol-lactonase n=1 Tax=Rhizobium sp. TaxID=391 RepID=UPI0034C6630A